MKRNLAVTQQEVDLIELRSIIITGQCLRHIAAGILACKWPSATFCGWLFFDAEAVAPF